MIQVPVSSVELSSKDISDIWRELKQGERAERVGNCGYWAGILHKKLADEGVYTGLIRIALAQEREAYHMIVANRTKQGQLMVLDPTYNAYANGGGILHGAIEEIVETSDLDTREPDASQELVLIANGFKLLQTAEQNPGVNNLRLPGHGYTQVSTFDSTTHVLV